MGEKVFGVHGDERKVGWGERERGEGGGGLGKEWCG